MSSAERLGEMNKQLETKLILVDGLSGSGKSTTCQWLTLQLQRNHLKARWLFEANVAHPLHWWEFWDGNDYHPPDFEGVGASEFIEKSIQKWKAFAADIQSADEVCVAESIIFLLGLGMLLQADAKPAELIRYGRLVHDIIKGLKPILFYFRQIDIPLHLHRICAIRGKALEAELIANMERTPYFKHRNLAGLDGVVQLWEETQMLTDRLVPEYTIRKLAIETTDRNWAYYQRQILDFLSLSLIEDKEIVRKQDLESFVGRYWSQEGETEHECEITLEADYLAIHSAEPQAVGLFFGGQISRLIPIDPHTFYVGVSPVIITFLEDAASIGQKMSIDTSSVVGREPRIWVKTMNNE